MGTLVGIILIAKSPKKGMRKENRKSVSFMNIDAKILDKILTSNQYIEKEIHLD